MVDLDFQGNDQQLVFQAGFFPSSLSFEDNKKS